MFFYRTSGQTVEKVTKMKDTALIQPFIACHPSGDKLKLITSRVNYRHCSLKIKGQIIYINDQTTTIKQQQQQQQQQSTAMIFL